MAFRQFSQGSPLVSVITSTYNASRYLEANIKSMLQQDYENWEHIIVDCGSKDGSVALISSMNHPRLRLIEVPFCGVAKARNIGIQQCRGEVIAILDADDKGLPERLSKQVSFLNTHVDVVGVGAGIINFEEDTDRSKILLYPNEHQSIMLLLRAGINPIPHSTFLFRRSVFESVGGYSEIFEKSEDFELLLKFSLIGHLASLPYPLVRLTTHSDSHSFAWRPKGRNDAYYAILALILHSCNPYTESLKDRVEKWLDELGVCGWDALRSRWALRAILKNVTSLDSWSLRYLAAFSLDFWKGFQCRRREWWKFANTPEQIGNLLASKGDGDEI